MTTAAGTPTTAPTNSGLRLLAPFIGLTTLGVLLQAVSAGIFMAIKGDDAFNSVHEIVGYITTLVSVVTAVIAVVVARKVAPRVAAASVVLAVAMIVQTGLGKAIADAHVQGLTAVHVPLALLIFGATIWLSAAAAAARKAA